jgi:uncharacterized protein YgbK (DUF1537 family)
MTGAIEAGALLAGAGYATEVTWPGATPPEDVSTLVIDVEVRHASAAEARSRFRSAALRVASATKLYIKTDSTLRGPVGAMLRGVLDVFPERSIVFSPAYPGLSRTVAGGVMYVGGVPVSETAFAADPRCEVRESRIAALLATRGLDDTTASAVLICDAQEDADLERLAKRLIEASDGTIGAGSGGLARYWVGFLKSTNGATPKPRQVTRWLVVSGSRHPVSRAQVNRARSRGMRVIAADPEPPGDPGQIAGDLAVRAARLILEEGYDGLMVFGGDTTFAVIQALGCTTIRPIGEVAPGIPVSVAVTPRANLTLVTKAGGFGAEDTVGQILESMSPVP